MGDKGEPGMKRDKPEGENRETEREKDI